MFLRYLRLFFFAGNRILTLGEVPKDQVYALKLKGVSICFSMLKAALSGSYVNFGVFRLYGDDALDNALQTFIKLLLSIPHSDLLVRMQSSSCPHLNPNPLPPSTFLGSFSPAAGPSDPQLSLSLRVC